MTLTLEQFKTGLKKEVLRRKRKKEVEARGKDSEYRGYMVNRKLRRKSCH